MKSKATKLFVGAVAVIIAGYLVTSCQNSISPGGSQNTPGTQTGNITGKVITTNNTTVAGIMVKTGTLVAYTDSKGEFYLSNVPVGDRILLNFSSDYYAFTQKIIPVKFNRTSYVEAAVLPVGLTQTLNAVTGGTLQFSNAKVIFPPNALVSSDGKPFGGSATVKATYFDPTATIFTGCFPGDFSGVRQDNSTTMIESFGFVNVEIYNGTEKLQLRQGQQATLTFPLPAAISSKAPQTIPLWYYNEVKGSWIEEGAAVKTGGSYVGSVGHFSSWNCDMPAATSYLQGHVLDQNGNPISFATVNSQGVDYSGSSRAYTDDNGYFKLAVKSASSAKIWANYHIITSTPQTVATPATSAITDIGNIVLPIDTLNMCIIVGRYVDNANNPVSNLHVSLKDKAGKVLDYVYTNLDGKFKFFGELGAAYTIEALIYVDSAKTSDSRDIVCPTTAETLDLGNIKLDIGGSTVIGRVVDVGGKPLAGVNIISSQGTAGTVFSGQKREMVTDSTGTFTIWVRPNVTFDIRMYYQSVSKVVNTTSGILGETKNLGDVVFP